MRLVISRYQSPSSLEPCTVSVCTDSFRVHATRVAAFLIHWLETPLVLGGQTALKQARREFYPLHNCSREDSDSASAGGGLEQDNVIVRSMNRWVVEMGPNTVTL